MAFIYRWILDIADCTLYKKLIWKKNISYSSSAIIIVYKIMLKHYQIYFKIVGLKKMFGIFLKIMAITGII